MIVTDMPPRTIPALVSLLLVPVASASEVSWDAAPTALEQASVPLIAMLVIALIILFATAWVRVATGRSLDTSDDD